MPKRNSKRYSSESLEISNWKFPDEGALSDEKERSKYFSRKKAVQLYLAGASERQIKDQAGIGIKQAHRLVRERCLAVHVDGEVWGWRGLVPWERINAYHRRHKITVDKFGYGASGALSAVLDAHPQLRAAFTKRIVSSRKPDRLTMLKHGKHDDWSWFLDQLRSLGYEVEGKWPFNTETLAYSSICKYIDAVLADHPEAGALSIGGPDAKRKMLSGDGNDRPVTYLFQRVEMDAHKLDGRFSVMLPLQDGGYRQKIVHRIWVIVIIEVMSRAVIGYHLSMRKEVSKTDVLRAIKMALTRWRRPKLSFSDLAYKAGANLPSGMADTFVGVCWDETSVDGALAETCRTVRDVLRDVVDSDLIEPSSGFSQRRSPDDRPFIEAFFKKLGEGTFQKMSNTTGSKPEGKQGRDPDKVALTSQFQIEYAEELLTAAIANYNATLHWGIPGRTPLEYLQFRSQYPDRPLRYADANSVESIVSFRKLCVVHGGYKQGRRPFVYFAYGRYTGDTLAQRHDLVGQKIWISTHIDNDIRVVRASTESGQNIGTLRVSPPWNKLPHSLEVRNAVSSFMKTHKIKCASGQDWVQFFIDYCENQPGKKLPVHPAYLEARRILVETAESITGKYMLDIAEERATNAKKKAKRDTVETSATSANFGQSPSASNKLPPPRKAANR